MNFLDFRKIISTKIQNLYNELPSKKLQKIETKINAIIDELQTVKKVRLIYTNNMSNLITNIEKRLEVIESKLLFAQVFDQIKVDVAGIASFKTDKLGKCIWTSKPYQKLTDISLENSLGDGWISIIHPNDKEIVLKHWNDCVKNNSDFNMEYNYVNHSTNQTIPVSVDAFRIIQNHQIIGWIGIVTPK